MRTWVLSSTEQTARYVHIPSRVWSNSSWLPLWHVALPLSHRGGPASPLCVWAAEWNVCTGGCLLFLPCTDAEAAQSPVALASSSTCTQLLVHVLAVQRHEQAKGEHLNGSELPALTATEHCIQALHCGLVLQQKLTDKVLLLAMFKWHLSAIS